MKAAAIVPVSCLSLLGNFTYHMALAHLVLGENKKYRDFYKRTRKGTLILDNSAHELGEGLGIEELKKAIKLVDPDTVVVPDKKLDAKRTIELARNFLPITQSYPEIRFMLVPQGLDEKEHIKCLKELMSLGYGKQAIIGLNKSAGRLLIRKDLAQWTISKGYDIHFLGIWSDPVFEILEAKGIGSDKLLGIDSSYPVRLALSGRTLLEPFPTPQNLDFTIPSTQLNLPWIRRQLKAYQWLVESDCSSKEELERAYKEGRFDEL